MGTGYRNINIKWRTGYVDTFTENGAQYTNRENTANKKWCRLPVALGLLKENYTLIFLLTKKKPAPFYCLCLRHFLNKDKALDISKEGPAKKITSPSRAWLQPNAFLVLACLPACLPACLDPAIFVSLALTGAQERCRSL